MRTSPHPPLRSSCRIVLAALALASLVHPSPGGGDLHAEPPAALVFVENQRTETVEVNGRDVVVNGNRNSLILRGECRTLTVNGNGNTVYAETVAAIVLPGNKNQVIWSKVAVGGGEKPPVTDVGNGNAVTARPK